MKLTKQLRSEILDVYEAFLGSLFNVDIEIYGQVLDDNYRLIGTTNNEVFFNKKDAINFLKATGDQLAGNIERRKSKIKIETVDDLVLITEQFDAYVLIENDWSFYGKVRVSTLMQQKTSGWKIVQQHFSIPDTKAEEGQTVGLEKITKENLELRDAIKRRTIELEHKNRELEIEAALERVRARAMAMQNSDELKELIGTVFTELTKLDLVLTRCVIMIYDGEEDSSRWWMANSEDPNNPAGFYIKRHEHPPMVAYFKAWRERKRKYTYALQGNIKHDWDDFLFSETELKNLPGFVIEGMKAPDLVYLNASFNNFGNLTLASLEPMSDEHFDILLRFAKVFDLTYTRFNDLKQAEAQARESQIQLALERVRARTMAMQKSDELREVVSTLYEQLSQLNFDSNACNIIIIDKETNNQQYWVSGFKQKLYPESYNVPYFEHPYIDVQLQAWRQGQKYTVIEYSGITKKEFDKQFFSLTEFKNIPQEVQKIIKALESAMVSTAFFAYGALQSIGPGALNDENAEILQRFASVFDQTYTRFLDLQKAEAQSKESQIQLALERVRARTMAMQKSEELSETSFVLFQQFRDLGSTASQMSIGIIHENENFMEMSATIDGNQLDYVINVSLDEPVVMKKLAAAWKEQKRSLVIDIYGDELREYNEYRNSIGGKFKFETKEGDHWVVHIAFFSKGMLSFSSHEVHPDETVQLLERFAAVFDLTYTRFLDLKNAEAQARESQIQLALERVRARTMAMQKSDELPETSYLLFQQVKELGETTVQNSIGIVNEEAGFVELSTTVQGHHLPHTLKVPIDDPYVMAKAVAAWKAKHKSLKLEFEGQELQNYNEHRNSFFETKVNFPEDHWIVNIIFFSKGWLSFSSDKNISDETFDLLKRFAAVFEQTYTRFNDLKQAEEQAREAQIEVALERVRARAMAMHTSQELKDVALELRNQMGTMAQPDLEVCAIQLYEESPDYFEAWGAVRPPGDDGKIIQVQVKFPKKGIKIVDEMFQQYESGVQDYVLVNEGEKVPEWLNVLKECVPEGYEMVIQSLQGRRPEDTRAYWSMADFKGGSLVMTTYIPPSDDARKLLRRFANVFGLAYRRFIDLKNAELQKREAQIELALERVRARTMAMHKSEELAETAQVLFQQLSELGGFPDRIAIGIPDEANAVVNFWTTDQQGSHLDHSFSARSNERTTLAKTYEAWKEQKKSLVIDLHGEELKEWIQFAREEMGIAVNADQIKDRRVHTMAFFSHGWILVTSHEPQSAETIQILERFASVFNLTYRRFLDLKKAEAQAHEARIEISLERIRSRALAMHKSDELMEVAKVVWEQMTLLGQRELESSVVHLYEEDPDHIQSYRAVSINVDSNTTLTYGHMAIPKNSCEFVREWLANFYSDLPEYTLELTGAKQQEWYEQFFKLAPEVVNSMRQRGDIHQKRYYRFSKFSGGALLMVLKQEPSEEASYLQRRAAVVFDLAYRRFSDLQKAEAQARESQIEAALERVRARSLAMHKSDELQEVVNTVFEKLQELNVEMDSCNIAIFKEGTRDYDYWIASPVQNRSAVFHMPYMDLLLTKDLVNARAEGVDAFSRSYSFEEKNEWFEYAYKHSDFGYLPEDRKKYIAGTEGISYAIAFAKNTGVQINRYSKKIPSDTDIDILKRFSKVFEQAYIRFLDLERSEAQAREAQIEAALERVRARTMGMHQSKDLHDVIETITNQLLGLGLKLDNSVFCRLHEDESWEMWMSTPEQSYPSVIHVPYLDHRIFNNLKEVKAKKIGFYTDVFDQEEARMFFKHFFENTIAINIPEERKQYVLSRSGMARSLFLTKDIWFVISRYSPDPFNEEENGILKRFAKVFEQSYIRFLDLQKAEAQAREAQIEAALERVRSSSLAMHKSEELKDVVKVVFDNFRSLGLQSIDSVNINIFHEGSLDFDLWLAAPGQDYTTNFHLPYLDHPIANDFFKAVKKGETIHKAIYEHDLKNKYFGYMFEYSDNKNLPEERKKLILNGKAYSVATGIAKHSSIFIHNYNGEAFSEETNGILVRFSKVFDQAYTRFLDLQKAEAQARESQIEASLERVRSKTMAMHNSQEVGDTVATMFDELVKLGVETVRCGVGIMHEDNQMELWTAKKSENEKVELIIGRLDMTIHPLLQGMYNGWKNKKTAFSYELKGDDLVDYFTKLINSREYRIKYDIASLPQHQFQNGFYFPEGAIYAFSAEQLSTEASQIFKRFAGVFGQTYRRYLDLQKAEAQAKEARIEASLERVRSKTMAMHNSQDVGETVATMFDELVKLGVETVRCGIAIIDVSKTMEVWTASPKEDGSVKLIIGQLDMRNHPLFMQVYNAWKNKELVTTYELIGEDLKDYFRNINNSPDYPIRYDIESLPNRQSNAAFMFPEGALFVFSQDPLVTETTQIFKRFAGVFGQTYRRYLDLQRAEAQAREAQIEAALERVRAKAMAMHKSEDLNAAVATVFEELDKLDLGVLRCGISILDKEKRTGDLWVTSKTDQGSAVHVSGDESFDIHPLLQGAFEAWLKKEDFSYLLEGDELTQYYNAVKAANFQLPESQTEFKQQYFYTTTYGAGGLFAVRETEFPEEAKTVMKRFASVFDLTYKRFLDLQKAEANAREAQIQLALERVRARTMAMHSSEDVTSATKTMFDELKKLGIDNLRCGIANIHHNRTFDVFGVTNLAKGNTMSGFGLFGMDEHPVWQRWFESWNNKEEVFIAFIAGQEKEDYFNNINNHHNYLPQQIVDFPDSFFEAYYFEQGSVWTYSVAEHSEVEKGIMKRFAAGFSLTFRRYQDLKKAEAQAREAQVEAGLERVRARTMAMHSSEDVSMATATMFTELEKLGIENLRGGITIIKPDQTQEVWSITNLPDGRTIRAIGVFDMNLHPLWRALFKARENNKDYDYYWLAGKDKEDYIAILNKTPNYLAQPIKEIPDVHVQSYFFGEGGVWTNSLQPHSEEDKQVMKRFASVFSLTFRRYQDLKKAEAQAREATIEAALEKVRGKAMAMHNSNDLSVTVTMIISELRKLGISPIRCGVGIINKETHKGQLYTATTSADGDSLSVVGSVLLYGHPVLENIYQKWVDGEDYFPELTGDSMRSYYEQLLAGLSVPLPDFKDEQKHYGHFFAVSVGCLYAWADVKYNDDEIRILKRFATIIDLTFRRYFELQKSEANAREAVKQAALDRVRADIASMRSVSDLERITPLIWNELTTLGIPFIRCGVFIMDEEPQLIHTFLSTPDGKAIAAFHLPYATPGNLSHVISNWKAKRKYIDHWDQAEFIQFAEILVQQGALTSAEQYLKTIPKGGFHLHFLPFLQGMLYVGNTTQLGEEEIELIQHVADAFSTAYARYEDFNKLEAAKQQVEKTLTDLKQAQTQLVQSEKMASLGELTAGIAHEIQNPLNFVNNFSDVSNELLEEMKTELEKGNKEDAIAIVEDVKQNLEKILHHGKRADAIVKGMLQHSRTSSGQKEPTDINLLADEYLRLAFHGLRAKDKSFNAKFETEFDSSIEKINIIPQDIGRVVLNLINNAFYAVTEKKKHASAGSASNGYEPTVTVITKKENGKIEIKVKDNGSGIPPKVLEKIFQPFFTTKPTGQGTGLGLSLAYDIVTKGHGGELKVETKEGEGTEFIIQLSAT